MPTIETKLTECTENINELFNTLMILEMQLVEQLEVEPDGHLARGLRRQLQNPASGHTGEDRTGGDWWVTKHSLAKRLSKHQEFQASES